MCVVHPVNLEALLSVPGKRGRSGYNHEQLKPVLLKGAPSHLQPSNPMSPRQVAISPGKGTALCSGLPLLSRWIPDPGGQGLGSRQKRGL